MLKDSRKTLIYALIVVILTAILTVSATYAWLGVSRVPFVSDVSVSVITDAALLIAPDENGQPGTWGNTFDASALLEGMVPLKPVTYTPDGFEKVLYDVTGRTAGTEPVEEANINVHYPDGASKTSAEAKAMEALGYMVRLDFWLKCDGANANVFLEDAIERADGQMGAGTYVVGSPVWDQEQVAHRNGGHRSETTVRYGFAYTPTDLNGNEIGSRSFIMYEPNADIHYNGYSGYLGTESIRGGDLIDKSHLIVQEASSWNENTPTLESMVIYHAGKFTTDTHLFKIDTSMMMKVSLYLWIEGQDIDCIAETFEDAVTLASHIQFGADGVNTQTGISRGN